MPSNIITMLILLFVQCRSIRRLLADIKPTESTQSSSGHISGHYWAEASNPGSNSYQQDRYHATAIPDSDGTLAMFYACYDGHGTERIAEKAKNELPNFIATALESGIGPNWAAKQVTSAEYVQIKITVRLAILTYDKDQIFVLRHGPDAVGGTTVSMVIETKYYFIVINLGDSQARLYEAFTRKEIYRTKLHEFKKGNEEYTRAKFAGFHLTSGSPMRVKIAEDALRAISVARALGDNYLKTKSPKSDQYGGALAAISPVAAVDIIEKAEHEIYIIALFSDGIGDLTDYVEKYKQNPDGYPVCIDSHIAGIRMGDLETSAQKIVDSFVTPTPLRRNHDNMGILIAMSGLRPYGGGKLPEIIYVPVPE